MPVYPVIIRELFAMKPDIYQGDFEMACRVQCGNVLNGSPDYLIRMTIVNGKSLSCIQCIQTDRHDSLSFGHALSPAGIYPIGEPVGGELPGNFRAIQLDFWNPSTCQRAINNRFRLCKNMPVQCAAFKAVSAT